MKNLGNMMKQAQAMQAKMAEAQAKLEQMTVEGASGGGGIIPRSRSRAEATWP